MMQKWESILWSAGSWLNLSKCFYFVLAWNFTEQGEATPKSLHELQHIIPQCKIVDHANMTTQPICHVDCSQGERTLGSKIAAGGNTTDKITCLQTKADGLATALKCTKNYREASHEVSPSNLYTLLELHFRDNGHPEKGFNKGTVRVQNSIATQIALANEFTVRSYFWPQRIRRCWNTPSLMPQWHRHYHGDHRSPQNGMGTCFGPYLDRTYLAP